MRVSEPQLAELVQVLSQTVRRLDTEVTQLKQQLSAAQERLSTLEGRTPSRSPAASASGSRTTSTAGAEVQSEPTRAGYQVGSEREEIARGVGHWIRRCLNGQLRGLSGRERINLQSRIYLVIRDIDGQVHNPPLVYDSWRSCSAVVLRDKQSGDSIYIGLPTKTEARIAVVEAGLEISPALTERHGA